MADSSPPRFVGVVATGPDGVRRWYVRPAPGFEDSDATWDDIADWICDQVSQGVLGPILSPAAAAATPMAEVVNRSTADARARLVAQRDQ